MICTLLPLQAASTTVLGFVANILDDNFRQYEPSSSATTSFTLGRTPPAIYPVKQAGA